MVFHMPRFLFLVMYVLDAIPDLVFASPNLNSETGYMVIIQRFVPSHHQCGKKYRLCKKS
jgi:hypothetical protein